VPYMGEKHLGRDYYSKRFRLLVQHMVEGGPPAAMLEEKEEVRERGSEGGREGREGGRLRTHQEDDFYWLACLTNRHDGSHHHRFPPSLPPSPPSAAVGGPALVPVEDGGRELYEPSLPPTQGDPRERIQYVLPSLPPSLPPAFFPCSSFIETTRSCLLSPSSLPSPHDSHLSLTSPSLPPSFPPLLGSAPPPRL
jgi:hypothetical protein